MKLTQLEVELMNVLWKAHDEGKELTIVEVQKEVDKLSIPSVTQAFKHLVQKEAIKVTDFKLSSNVYARVFAPAISYEDYFFEALGRLKEDIYMGEETFRKSFIANPAE